jgi:hypothetical protein
VPTNSRTQPSRRAWLAVAVVVFAGVVSAATTGVRPARAQAADQIGRTVVDGDSFVEILGDDPGPGASLTPSGAGLGYAISDPVQRYAYGAYSIQLADARASARCEPTS